MEITYALGNWARTCVRLPRLRSFDIITEVFCGLAFGQAILLLMMMLRIVDGLRALVRVAIVMVTVTNDIAAHTIVVGQGSGHEYQLSSEFDSSVHRLCNTGRYCR